MGLLGLFFTAQTLSCNDAMANQDREISSWLCLNKTTKKNQKVIVVFITCENPKFFCPCQFKVVANMLRGLFCVKALHAFFLDKGQSFLPLSFNIIKTRNIIFSFYTLFTPFLSLAMYFVSVCLGETVFLSPLLLKGAAANCNDFGLSIGKAK